MATAEEELSRPQCVATTSDARPGDNIANSSYCEANETRPSIFYETQFSSDGTTLVTLNGDQSFRSYVLPSDLLENNETPRFLKPHSIVKSPSSIQSYALYPLFDLEDAATTVFLSASTDLPITLTNTLTGDTGYYKYALVNPTTEAYIAPKSLAWAPSGTRFVAGSLDQVSVFDAHADGQGPIMVQRTGATRKQRTLFGAIPTCKGWITALSINANGMLAAGSTERQVALYANEGAGEYWTSFPVADTPLEDGTATKGNGIMHLAWSPCGTYLLAAERQSDCIHVYDVRNTMRRVSVLSGRNALSTQRLGMDVVPTADGYEIWAGGADGCVRMWKNPGTIDGEHSPDLQWKMHDDPVSSAIWHPQGSVLATCSGRPRSPRGVTSTLDDYDDGKPADNTLKIWTA